MVVRNKRHNTAWFILITEEEYEKLKAKVDIKRVHALKHRAEVEDSAFAYYYLAYACEQIKDYKGAIEAINKAILAISGGKKQAQKIEKI